MRPIFKYFITNLLISVIGTALVYIFYPLITGHQNLSDIGSVFLVAIICSIFVHLIYLALFKWLLRSNQRLLFIKALVCFIIIPSCVVMIGLFTYGVDYKGVLLSAIAFGLPNAALPYLEEKLRNSR